MSTLHRHDMTAADFSLLAGFCRALGNVSDMAGGSIVWLLDEQEVWLPVWRLVQAGWELAVYKPFRRDCIGIETADFRRLCRYLRIRDNQLIDLLYRLSMLAVSPPLNPGGSPQFRLPFTGVRRHESGYAEPSMSFGFVIERRRAEGGFRTGQEVHHAG